MNQMQIGSLIITDHDDRATTSTLALDRLRAWIAAGTRPAGTRLPTERQLSLDMGVGRRAIRRALEVLEAEGRITRRQGAGTFIADPGATEPAAPATDYLQIMEVRLRIEPQLAALAALRATPAQIARMTELADRIGQSLDADEGELWDGALHRQIAQAAGNALFLSLFDMVNRVRQDTAWQAVRERARGGLPGHALPVAQHRAIVAAIAARDPQAAAEQMRAHLFSIQEKLMRLGTTGDDTGPDQPARLRPPQEG